MEECEKSEEEEEDNLDKVLLLRTTGEDGDIMSAARGSYGRPRLSCEQDTVMTPTSCEENPEDSNEILPPPPPHFFNLSVNFAFMLMLILYFRENSDVGDPRTTSVPNVIPYDNLTDHEDKFC